MLLAVAIINPLHTVGSMIYLRWSHLLLTIMDCLVEYNTSEQPAGLQVTPNALIRAI